MGFCVSTGAMKSQGMTLVPATMRIALIDLDHGEPVAPIFYSSTTSQGQCGIKLYTEPCIVAQTSFLLGRTQCP